MDEYAKNFKRAGIDSNADLLWYAKLEHFRYFSHIDKEVKNGIYTKGDNKVGEQMHIQVIVSRKDNTNKIKLSPMNNSRGLNLSHSLKLGQFDRKTFKQSRESLFDEMFGFNRDLKETIEYSLIMKDGNSEQKQKMFLLEQIEDNLKNNDQYFKQISGFRLDKSIDNFKTSDLIEILFSSEYLIYENEQDFIKNLKKKKKRQ